MKQLSKIFPFFIFPAAVFFCHLIASRVLDLYNRFPQLDIPFHFLGGLSIAYASAQILAYLEKEKISNALPKAIFLILIFGLTSIAAVFWEFAEFIGDRFLDINIQISLANTMQDQFMGMLGGATCVFIYFKKFTKTSKDLFRD